MRTSGRAAVGRIGSGCRAQARKYRRCRGRSAVLDNRGRLRLPRDPLREPCVYSFSVHIRRLHYHKYNRQLPPIVQWRPSAHEMLPHKPIIGMRITQRQPAYIALELSFPNHGRGELVQLKAI